MMKASELAAGRWSRIYRAVGIEPNDYFRNGKSRHAACPMCGGTDRFRFDDADIFEATGSYFCGGCGPGNGFSFLLNYRRGSFKDQCEFIEHLFGERDGFNAQNTARPAAPVWVAKEPSPEEVAKVKAKLLADWSKGIRITEGDVVWRYLVDCRMLPVMRWPKILSGARLLEACSYFCQEDNVEVGSFPAMLWKVVGADGKVVNLHRTYLDRFFGKAKLGKTKPNKEGKCLERPGKKLMKGLSANGGAIRLVHEVGEELALTEGVETALAVYVMTGIPVWACVSATMMKSCYVPPHVKVVHIYADNDAPDKKGRRAGQEAAEALAQKLRAIGVTVHIHLPPVEGEDWCDVWAQKVQVFRTQRGESPTRSSLAMAG